MGERANTGVFELVTVPSRPGDRVHRARVRRRRHNVHTRRRPTTRARRRAGHRVNFEQRPNRRDRRTAASIGHASGFGSKSRLDRRAGLRRARDAGVRLRRDDWRSAKDNVPDTAAIITTTAAATDSHVHSARPVLLRGTDSSGGDRTGRTRPAGLARADPEPVLRHRPESAGGHHRAGRLDREHHSSHSREHLRILMR